MRIVKLPDDWNPSPEMLKCFGESKPVIRESPSCEFVSVVIGDKSYDIKIPDSGVLTWKEIGRQINQLQGGSVEKEGDGNG